MLLDPVVMPVHVGWNADSSRLAGSKSGQFGEHSNSLCITSFAGSRLFKGIHADQRPYPDVSGIVRIFFVRLSGVGLIFAGTIAHDFAADQPGLHAIDEMRRIQGRVDQGHDEVHIAGFGYRRQKLEDASRIEGRLASLGSSGPPAVFPAEVKTFRQHDQRALNISRFALFPSLDGFRQLADRIVVRPHEMEEPGALDHENIMRHRADVRRQGRANSLHIIRLSEVHRELRNKDWPGTRSKRSFGLGPQQFCARAKRPFPNDGFGALSFLVGNGGRQYRSSVSLRMIEFNRYADAGMP
jgi:hypothetical protein